MLSREWRVDYVSLQGQERVKLEQESLGAKGGVIEEECVVSNRPWST